MSQSVILPYTPLRTTPQDVAQLHVSLAHQRPAVRLQAYDAVCTPIWLGGDFPKHTITITLNNVPRLSLYDYIPGPKFFAQQLSKVQLLQRLIDAKIPVPHSTAFTADVTPTEDIFGPYMAIKTTVPFTSRAAGIFVFKTAEFDQLRATFLETFQADIAQGYAPVLQQYILTGPKPCHTRVSTFLGAPVVCFEVTAPNLFDPAALTGMVGGAATSNFSADRTRQLINDEELVDMSKKVALAFPEVSVLGIDLVRCTETGKAYCLEANLGNLAVLSAPICDTLRAHLGAPAMHKQFGSYDMMARRMIETLDAIGAG